MKTAPVPPHRAARMQGHAMTETLLVISFAAIALAAIPAIAEYGTKRQQTVAAAKLLAWQRTVWMPGTNAIDAAEAKGASGAIKKSDFGLGGPAMLGKVLGDEVAINIGVEAGFKK